MSASGTQLRQISWLEFVAEYRPRPNTRDPELGCEGYLLDRTGVDYEQVATAMQKNPACIWTCVEDDNLQLRICSGYSLLNRRGYLITEVPFNITREYIHVDLE